MKVPCAPVSRHQPTPSVLRPSGSSAGWSPNSSEPHAAASQRASSDRTAAGRHQPTGSTASARSVTSTTITASRRPTSWPVQASAAACAASSRASAASSSSWSADVRSASRRPERSSASPTAPRVCEWTTTATGASWRGGRLRSARRRSRRDPQPSRRSGGAGFTSSPSTAARRYRRTPPSTVDSEASTSMRGRTWTGATRPASRTFAAAAVPASVRPRRTPPSTASAISVPRLRLPSGSERLPAWAITSSEPSTSTCRLPASKITA